jgi:hypothetical protein
MGIPPRSVISCENGELPHRYTVSLAYYRLLVSSMADLNIEVRLAIGAGLECTQRAQRTRSPTIIPLRYYIKHAR